MSEPTRPVKVPGKGYRIAEVDAYIDHLEARIAELEAENRRLHDSIEMLETVPGNEQAARLRDEVERLRGWLVEIRDTMQQVGCFPHTVIEIDAALASKEEA